MRAAVHVSKEEASPWGIPASLLFHGLLVVALLLSPAAPRLMQAPDASVAVDILTPQQFHAAVDPEPASPPPVAAPAPSAPESAALPPAAPPIEPKAPSGMIVAKTMLSEKTLADPRSRQAREGACDLRRQRACRAAVQSRSDGPGRGLAERFPPGPAGRLCTVGRKNDRRYDRGAKVRPSAAAGTGTTSSSNARSHPTTPRLLPSSSRSAIRFRATDGKSSACRRFIEQRASLRLPLAPARRPAGQRVYVSGL